MCFNGVIGTHGVSRTLAQQAFGGLGPMSVGVGM